MQEHKVVFTHKIDGKNYDLIEGNISDGSCRNCTFEDSDCPEVATPTGEPQLLCSYSYCSYFVESTQVTPEIEPEVKPSTTNALTKQIGGGHYKDFGIQPVEYIHANNLSFLEGNVVKYITRHKAKNGIEDIKKVIHYCELIMELEYNQKGTT